MLSKGTRAAVLVGAALGGLLMSGGQGQAVARPAVAAAPAARAGDLGLLYQTVRGACSILSRTRFNVRVDAVTVEDSYRETYAQGRWVMLVVSATNTGRRADGTFQIVDLVDGDGNRYAAVTSEDVPDLFDRAAGLGVLDHVEGIDAGATASVLWVYDAPPAAAGLKLLSSYASCRS